MAKKVKYPHINHPFPIESKARIALLPIGLFLNREIQEAKIGDTVEFWTDWRYERAKLVYKCEMSIKTAIFSYLMRLAYGKNMTIVKMLERWNAQSVIEGFGQDGFDRDKCLMIEVKEIESSGISVANNKGSGSLKGKSV